MNKEVSDYLRSNNLIVQYLEFKMISLRQITLINRSTAKHLLRQHQVEEQFMRRLWHQFSTK